MAFTAVAPAPRKADAGWPPSAPAFTAVPPAGRNAEALIPSSSSASSAVAAVPPSASTYAPAGRPSRKSESAALGTRPSRDSSICVPVSVLCFSFDPAIDRSTRLRPLTRTAA